MKTMIHRLNCLQLERAARACTLFLVLLFLGFPVAAQKPPEIATAEALMKEGKAAEAYRLLEPLEDKLAGDVDFDYLLGIAALDSGKADKATLAFERVLAVNPGFAGARLDMARAYYQLGDIERAKTEFTAVLGQNPPEAARLTINRYLDEIAKREKSSKTLVRGYMEGTFGRDTNVNNSTSQSQVTVPALGNLNFTLAPINVKRADYYWLLGAGGEVAHEVTPVFAVFGAVDTRYRENFQADLFDYKSVDGRAGATFAIGKSNLLRVTLGMGEFYLDHVRNRDVRSVAADWRYTKDPANQFNFFAQQTWFRFTGALAVNDFGQTVGGVGWLRYFNEGKSALSASLFGGEERDMGLRADGDKSIAGVRLAGQLALRDNLDFFAVASAQRGNYDRQNVSFQTTREDRQYDATLGMNWRFREAWTARPQLLYVRNNSNIPLFSYDRWDFSVTLRRDFQ